MSNDTTNRKKVATQFYVSKDLRLKTFIVYQRELIAKVNGKDKVCALFPYENGESTKIAALAGAFCKSQNAANPTKVSLQHCENVATLLDSAKLLNEYLLFLVGAKVRFALYYDFVGTAIKEHCTEVHLFYQENVIAKFKRVTFTEKEVLAYPLDAIGKAPINVNTLQELENITLPNY